MTNLNQHTKEFVQNHESDDIRKLALQAKRYPDIDMALALQQIAGKQIAKYKIPTWYTHRDIMYPIHLSMEQCSSEQTALYKASLCEGEILIDLTGGLGVDFSFMAKSFKEAIYVEKQNQLIELAKHNFKVLDLKQAQIIEDNSLDFLESYNQIADIIFIDPARRSQAGRKTVLIEDCTPNLIELDKLFTQKAHKTIIKLSPMLDITHGVQSLSNVTDIHIVSVNNECKELLLVKSAMKKETDIHCINIVSDNKKEVFIFTKKQEEALSIDYTSDICSYLYEPNSSIMKAGAYKSIAQTFCVKKLHANSHLYTSEHRVPDFPGRTFLVRKILSSNKKELSQNLKDIKQANISTRNYPLSVAEIRKQTKLKEGGDDYIFATTLSNEKKTLILCSKLLA